MIPFIKHRGILKKSIFMIKIGITGQAGFVGTHLFNTIGLYPGKFVRIPFEDVFFSEGKKLIEFVQKCDVIVHLAAMNRHTNSEILYQTNINLIKRLISACESNNSTPYILFSSSTQEELDNMYGKSKKEGRQLFEHWSIKNNAKFTGLVIPNVFGPFGNPFYNSVVATFCHQLTHNEHPKIEVDGNIKLIYVGELVQYILEMILNYYTTDILTNVISSETIFVPHTIEIKVSTLLYKLNSLKEHYFTKGEIPALDSKFHLNLFNTFLTYIDYHSFYPFKLRLNNDERGSFFETVKLNSGGQVSFSTTFPGKTRGNHFHTRKAERFVVIKGKAKIELRRIGTNNIISINIDGNAPSFVDIPIWYTHNITNIGEVELYTIFWSNEHFDADDLDTYFEQV